MNRIILILVLFVFLTTPMESAEIAPNISVVKLVSAILILFTLFSRINVYNIHEPFLVILLVYTLFTIFSFLWSIDKALTFNKSMTTILPNFLLTLIIYYSVKTRNDLDKMLLFYITGCIIVSGISLYIFATQPVFLEEEEGRVTVLNQDQNELSYLLSFGIVSILYLVRYTDYGKILKLILLAVAMAFSFVILSTGSRMGMVLLLMIAAVLSFVYLRKGLVIFLLPLIIISGIVFMSFLPEETFDRLMQTKDQIASRDLTGRVVIWKTGLEAFENKNAYILGTGFYTFRTLLSDKTGWDPAAHNTYLSTLVETGTTGFLILMALIFYLTYRIYYLIRNGSLLFSLFLFPLLATMLVLGTNNRRWLFISGVIIVKLYHFAKEELTSPNSLDI